MSINNHSLRAMKNPEKYKKTDSVKKEERQISGIYFRVKVGERFENICFEDCTEEQQKKILETKNTEFKDSLCRELANTLNRICERFDITANRDS